MCPYYRVMDTIQAAKHVILDAEAALRDLISTALAERRYGDVKVVAELANRVAQLSAGTNTQLSVSASEPVIDKAALDSQPAIQSPPPDTQALELSAKRTTRADAKKKASVKSGYPKFVRDDDRLVKIGWSKKNQEEYEHRVPRETVLVLLHHLVSSVEEARVFDIDGLFPIRNTTGEDVPGYQVYVVVAWLREAGVIEKKGRDGYFIRDKSVLSGELNELWKNLRARTA